MLGYWLGAMLTSIASGLVIVFVVQGHAGPSTHPGSTFVVGILRRADRRRSRWAARHGTTFGVWGLGILGVVLAIISIIGLLSG